MAQYQSTYKVKLGDTVKMLFFPFGFREGIPCQYEELVSNIAPLQFGDMGYNVVHIIKRGLFIVKLDKTKMGSLNFSTEESKSRMKPIYVVNMKYLIGRKITFQEFVNYFFSVEVKITATGEEGIGDEEFPMNTYHDDHVSYLLQHRPQGVPLQEYFLLGISNTMSSSCFINQMHAQHLFNLKVQIIQYVVDCFCYLFLVMACLF